MFSDKQTYKYRTADRRLAKNLFIMYHPDKTGMFVSMTRIHMIFILALHHAKTTKNSRFSLGLVNASRTYVCGRKSVPAFQAASVRTSISNRCMEQNHVTQS